MKQKGIIFKLLFTVLFIALLTIRSTAQIPLEIPLWPKGTPNDNGLRGNEQTSEGGRVSNVTVPTIKVYMPAKSNGMTIIMCPGGGYTRLAMNHEGIDMASWLTTIGITYIILKYRMPNGHCEIPLSDAEQAMRLVRKNAVVWGINPHRIGIMGASAGGHLAASLSTLFSSDETRPDFQILLYPVISMMPNLTHAGSQKCLLGDSSSISLQKKYSLELQVTSYTPQAFIALSADDGAVPPINSINYFLALQKLKIPVTLHVYPTGQHGWGFHDSFIYKREWTEELEKWLRNGLSFSK